MRFNSKPKSRWTWLLIAAVPVVAFLVAGKTMNANPPTNTAQTTPDETPELRTRVCWQDVETVTQAARDVALQQTTWLRSWRVVKTDENTIHVEVPVLFFTDDLTVHVDTDDKGQTRVNAESKSRVGQGDFGENRRHVAQFLRALDQTLIKRGT